MEEQSNSLEKKVIVGLFLVIVIFVIGIFFVSTKKPKNPSSSGGTTNTKIASVTKPPPLYTILVSVFIDSNVNKQLDPTEKVYANKINVSYGVGDKTTKTGIGNDGQFLFTGVQPGTYTVSLTNVPVGYSATMPISIQNVTVPPDKNLLFGIKPQ